MNRALIFLAAGVILGLLLAPEKGTKLRKLLSGKLENIANDTTEFLSDTASDLKANGKGIAAEAENRLATIG